MVTPIPTPTANPPSPPSEAGDGPTGPARTRRPRRVVWAGGLVVLAVAVALLVGSFWRFGASAHDPVIRFTQPVPVDVDTNARAAVASFVALLGARRDCVGTAEVVLVRDVAGGDARYLATDGTVEIEIPTTPARFRESLIHELAHHVEHRCPDFDRLRRSYVGRTAIVWTGQERWEERPSEQWAELVVELVLGERMLHGDEMSIDPVLVELVADWLAG